MGRAYASTPESCEVAMLATSGTGGIHLLNGLYDAKAGWATVLAIRACQGSRLTDTYTNKTWNWTSCFENVCVL